jgi:hypothetical protein
MIELKNQNTYTIWHSIGKLQIPFQRKFNTTIHLIMFSQFYLETKTMLANSLIALGAERAIKRKNT